MEAIDAAFTTATSVTVVLNTVDHGTFQDQITSYLGGTPDTALHVVLRVPDEVLRGAGPRRPDRRRVGQGEGNFTEGFANSVVGNDKKVYGIPVDYYPWAVFYRKSVFADKSYTVPKTWDELKALARKMQTDGLTPIAFGDKDGWPAMGTFDILNLRLNGYDFHVGLMAGKEKWTDPKVTAVFKKWEEIVPFQPRTTPASPGSRPPTRSSRRSPACTCSACSSRRSSPRPRTRPTWPTSTSSPSRPWARSSTPRRRSTPRSTPPDRREVAEPRGRAGRRQGVPRVLGQGLDPAPDVREPAGPASRRRTTPTSPATATSRRRPSRSSAAAQRITQFLDRDTPLRLRRRERHAELPADVPRQPGRRTPPPTRRPSRTSGTRCRPCPEHA